MMKSRRPPSGPQPLVHVEATLQKNLHVLAAHPVSGTGRAHYSRHGARRLECVPAFLRGTLQELLEGVVAARQRQRLQLHRLLAIALVASQLLELAYPYAYSVSTKSTALTATMKMKLSELFVEEDSKVHM